MKWLPVALLGLFLGTWFLNYPILSRYYDLNSCMQQYYFWEVRSVIYELMFLSLSIVCFIQGDGLVKALACFAVIMVAGSIVDKVFFKITDYNFGDIVLVFLGIITSVAIYGRTRKRA